MDYITNKVIQKLFNDDNRGRFCHTDFSGTEKGDTVYGGAANRTRCIFF